MSHTPRVSFGWKADILMRTISNPMATPSPSTSRKNLEAKIQKVACRVKSSGGRKIPDDVDRRVRHRVRVVIQGDDCLLCRFIKGNGIFAPCTGWCTLRITKGGSAMPRIGNAVNVDDIAFGWIEI